MIRIRFVFLCAFVTLWQISSAQITFQKSFSGGTKSYARKTDDGGYAVFTSKSSDVYLIKTDVYGDTLWTKTFGGSDQEVCTDGYQTSDLGYIITGYTSYLGYDHTSMFLIKLNQAGNVVWAKTFGDSILYYQPTSVIEANNGDYLVTGIVGDTMTVNYADIFVLSVSSLGSLNWMKSYDRSAEDYGYFIRETSDNGFIVAATSYVSSAYYLDLLKLTANGNVNWLKDYRYNSTINFCTSVQQTFDGGYVLTGHKKDSSYQSDVLLIKTDSVGDTMWTKVYGGLEDDFSFWVEQTSDSGYIISGAYTLSGSYKAFGLKTDQYGDTSWTRIYTASFGEGYTVQETSDNGYIFAGYRAHSRSAYFIKTNLMGNSGCDESYPQINVSVQAIQVSSPAISTFQVNPLVNPFAINSSYGGIIDTICSWCGLDVQINVYGDTIFCVGDSVTLEASIPNSDYIWSNGETTRSITVIDAGSFYVGISQPNGCTGLSDAISTTLNPLPIVLFTGLPDTVCDDWPPTFLTGIPGGGIFTGTGINDTLFIPSQANPGWNLISYQYSDSTGCSNSFIDSVFVEICLDVAHETSNGRIKIYFTNDQMIIIQSQDMIRVIEIIDALGVIRYFVSNNSKNYSTNTFNLPTGIYFVHIQTENGSFTQKLIKQ